MRIIYALKYSSLSFQEICVPLIFRATFLANLQGEPAVLGCKRFMCHTCRIEVLLSEGGGGASPPQQLSPNTRHPPIER